MLRGGIHGEKYAAIIAEEQMKPSDDIHIWLLEACPL